MNEYDKTNLYREMNEEDDKSFEVIGNYLVFLTIFALLLFGSITYFIIKLFQYIIN